MRGYLFPLYCGFRVGFIWIGRGLCDGYVICGVIGCFMGFGGMQIGLIGNSDLFFLP